MEVNEKKLHLILVAEKLFAQNGYSETSIRDIAREAAVNSAMISYYFGSKEKLIHAIFVYRAADLSKVFSKVNATESDAVKVLFTIVNFYIDKVFEQAHFYRLLFQIQAIEKDYELLKYFNDIRSSNFYTMQNYILIGKEKKVFRQDIDVSFFTSTIVGTINHMFFNQEQYKKVNNLSELSQIEFELLYKDKIKSHLNKIIHSLML